MLAGLVLVLVAQGCSSVAQHAGTRPGRSAVDQPTTVIEHVSVIPMTPDGAVLHDATVVIDKGRIVSLDGPIPRGARRIDGRGKWLIPGLTDMHVHVPTDGFLRPRRYPTEPPSMYFDTQDIMTPYVANGVTQILNLDARAESIAQRNQIEKGEVLGPHMALAALINGGKSPGRIANTTSDGRQAVRDAKAEGYDFIKVYSALDADTYAAIVDEAAQQGLKVVGHIPDAFAGQLDRAFVPNFAMVAHAEEFSKHSPSFSDEDARRFAQIARRNGTWLTPTLTAMRQIASQSRSLEPLRSSPALQYVHPLLQSKWLNANQYQKKSTPDRIAYFDQMVIFHERLVKACRAAGVPIVAGTDTLTSGVVAGFALQDELELLAKAGLTNEEVLASATCLPAVWLGVQSDRGTIQPGKRADLVLLDANPLLDIANTRRIAGVFVSGRWASRRTLDAMLADLSRRNTATLSQYDWTPGEEAPATRIKAGTVKHEARPACPARSRKGVRSQNKGF